jgi:hypothetical protein
MLFNKGNISGNKTNAVKLISRPCWIKCSFPAIVGENQSEH